MVEKDVLIYKTSSIKDALKKLDKNAKKVLLVSDNKNRLLGTITDGDIRRYLLSGRNLDNGVSEICNQNPIYLKKEDFTPGRAKEIIIKNKIELLPILDGRKKILNFITWDQLFSDTDIKPFGTAKLDIPVVIVAGGKGVRLDPFTRILPKALIPIGDKPIVEIIIEEFKKQGIKRYYITLNHKSEMIKSYFNSVEKDYKLTYVKEDNFLGTAGSLKLLSDKVTANFVVSNCDVIVKADFKDVLDFHKKETAYLTVLSSIKHYKIPYGVVKFKEGGEVEDIFEKPEYTSAINTGVYILNKKSLEYIPSGIAFDMTDLIKNLKGNNKKVIMYPVNESDYIDVGQWEEYKKAIESFSA